MTETGHQLDILRRMAEFSAWVRGHELAVWRNGKYSAITVCTKCGRAVTVHLSLFQPGIDGAALSVECDTAKSSDSAAPAAA